MSCNDTQIQIGDDHSSSDYGSDFTPDEEELLNELLARVATAQQPTATTTTATKPPNTPPASALTDLQPAQEPLVVPDIEDYALPQPTRAPRVFGREAWSPSSKRAPLSQNSGRRPPGSVSGHPGSTAGTISLSLFFF